jgi:hypothetical protein
VWIGSQGQSLCQQEKIILLGTGKDEKIGDRTNQPLWNYFSAEFGC